MTLKKDFESLVEFKKTLQIILFHKRRSSPAVMTQPMPFIRNVLNESFLLGVIDKKIVFELFGRKVRLSQTS